MDNLQDQPTAHIRFVNRPSLLTIWAWFALLNGALRFANTEWHPISFSYLFPWWACISAFAAIAYSRSGGPAMKRFVPSTLTVRTVLLAIVSGLLVVLILRKAGMMRLPLPEVSFPMRLTFIFAITILAPIAEEVLFRGIILDRLLETRGILFAVFLSSLAAALCHDAIVPAFLEHGIIAGVYVLTGRSLWASTLTHMSINAAALLPGLRR